MHVAPWVWALTLVVTVGVLAFDVFVVGRRPHVPSRREVTVALVVYIALAIAFGIGIWVVAGHRYGTEFFAGWLTEYSLSVDNLFIFLVIMGKFAVPRHLQQTALLIGIILALVFRGVFIGIGAAAIEHFGFVFYLFGLFLIWTAAKLAFEGPEDEDEYHEGPFTKLVRKLWPGASVLFLVTVALGTTDLLFALDSIPAIYGLTQEPFIVLTANIFALMGLRQLYFLIGGLLERLVFLSYGLAALLAFIGVKLVLHALHENDLPFVNGGEGVHWAPEIGIGWSLGAIVATLAVTVVASLAVSAHETPAQRDEQTGPRREF